MCRYNIGICNSEFNLMKFTFPLKRLTLVGESSLEIFDVRDSDEGNYQCVAMTSFKTLSVTQL